MAKVDSIPTLTGNKLIADFMGWQHHADHEYDKHEMENLTYHSNWGKLMAVVLKLEDKDVDVKIYYMNCKIEWMDSNDGYETKSGIQGDSKIEAVWTAICYFLIWVKDQQIDLDNPQHYD